MKDAICILDDLREETVEFLRELIMTSSPSGEEKAIAELIGKKLKDCGFEDIQIDRMQNVVCKIKGSSGHPTFLYNGHTDVVPLGDLGLWPVDPLKAPVIDGKIYGRGACDMKGSVAAMIMAAYALKEAGVELKGDLILTLVSQEELGLQGGTKYVIEEHGLKPDIALIGEPSNLNICLGCRGRIIVEVSVKGKSSHSAYPSKGINAINKMNKMIDAASHMKLPSHDVLGPTTQAITNITCKPGELNMIPSLCAITIDRRMVPGDSMEKTESEFSAVIDHLKTVDPDFDAHVKASRLVLPGYQPPEKSILHSLQESAKIVLGKSPRMTNYLFGTDGSYISNFAHIPWFGFGPGSETDAHTVNDHVRIDDLIASAEVYAQFIIALLS